MRATTLPCAVRWGGALCLLFFLYPAASAAGQELKTENPNKVKAGFLRNFAHYVSWPASSFANGSSPWHVCVLGSDPFGQVLEKTFTGRTEQGRTFEIFRSEKLENLPSCQIMFIAYNDAARRRAALAELKNRPVLTVGDAPDFLQEGGIIRFQVRDHMEMSINLGQARSVSLKIQTKMLEVAHEVVENGTTRRLR